MATYIDRANDIVAAGIDGVPTQEQKQRIADAATIHFPELLASLAVDPANPTGEEKAAVFVEAFRLWAKSWLRFVAEEGERSNHNDAVYAAGNNAANDI